MAVIKIALLLAVGLLSCTGFPQRVEVGEPEQHHHGSGQYVDQSEFPNGHVQGGVDVKPRLPGNGFAYLMGGYGSELKDLAGEDESGEGNTHNNVGLNDKPNENKHVAPKTQEGPGFGLNNGLNGQGQPGSPNQGNYFRASPNNDTRNVNQNTQTGFGGNNQGPQNGPGYNQGPVSGVGPSYRGPQNGPGITQDPYNQGGYNIGPLDKQNSYNNYPQNGPGGYNQGQGGYNNGPYNIQGGYNQGSYGNIPQNGPGGYTQRPRGYTPYTNQVSNGFSHVSGSNGFNGQTDVNLGGYRGTFGFGQGYGQNPSVNGYYQDPNEGNQGPSRRRHGYTQHQDGYDQNPTEFGQNHQGHRRPTSFAKGGRTFTKGGIQTSPSQNNYSQNIEQLNQGNSNIETTTSIASKLHDVELLPAEKP